MQNSDLLVLPRTSTSPIRAPIPAPPEEAFTSTFGKLLPAAKYVNSPHGRYAYYDLSTLEATHRPDSTKYNRVLLIHGVQTPALGMLPLARQLQESHPRMHFVLVDLWGHGLSDTPFSAHTPALFQGQITHLLDHLQWDPVHLIGYSFGGMLTAGFTAANPGCVKSYVLVAPAGLLRMSYFTEEERMLLGKGCRDEDAAQKLVIRTLEGGELVIPDDWKDKVAKGEVVAPAVKQWEIREHKGHTASVVAIFRDGGVMDNDVVFEGAGKTGIPNLVVLGELDDVCSEHELKTLGFGNIFVVPEVGHGVVREREGEVARHISQFWANIGLP